MSWATGRSEAIPGQSKWNALAALPDFDTEGSRVDHMVMQQELPLSEE